MTKSRIPEDVVMAEINITPFTDVLLVLLIIFMILAALTAPPGFQKQLSRCHCQGPRPAPTVRQIEIEVSRSNHVTIDSVPTRMAALYPTMVKVVREHSSHRGWAKHIALWADKDANYDVIIKVLDAARQAGDDDVGFVTY